MSLYVPGTAILLLCVGPLARWGTQLGGGVDPPRSSAGLATGVHTPPPGLRDRAVCGEQEKEREGCFGWGGGRRSQQPPQGEGAQRTPSPPFRLLPPSVPIAESSWIQKARGGSGSAREPRSTLQDTEKDGEWISRGSGSFQPWIHFLWTP